LPPLSEEDRSALARYQKRSSALREITLGCVAGNHTGAHYHGPPRVGKSHIVYDELRRSKAPWKLHQRVTAKPLYAALERDPGAVHVIEDCEQLMHEKSAQTLLRSVLGGERVDGHRERRVTYSVSGSRPREMYHYFYGSIILISNRPLGQEVPEVRAIMSRIPSIAFTPPDDEVRALMRNVARRGYVGEGGRMSPPECIEVVEYVIRVAAELECRLDLRWIEHGYGHYLTDVASGRVDWRDMIHFHCMNTITYFAHTCPASPAVKLATQAEVALAQEIEQMSGLTKEQRVALWAERTGRSGATYYRRLELGRGGRL
jgi:hypothetical protein